MPDDQEAARRALLASNLDDLARGLGISRPLVRRLLLPGMSWIAERFTGEVLEMDRLIGEAGFGVASDYLLRRFSGPVTVGGSRDIPAHGPLLVVANHPGTVDILCLWQLLRHRDDIRIIALDRPFLRAVPHLAARLLYVNNDGGVLREAARHLAAGGTLITFPAGHTEPDPMLRLDDAVANLQRWHGSTAALRSMVPELQVLPVAVGGVISRRWLRRFPARLRRDAADRELAAATLQIAFRDRLVTPQVLVGQLGDDASLPDLLRAVADGVGQV